MALHPHLKTTKHRLSKQNYIVTSRDNNVLDIAIEENTLPFCFVMIDEDTFNGLIVSFAANFPYAHVVADISVNLMHIAPVAVGESFFIDDEGETFWGNDALMQSSMQEPSLLESVEPISQLKH